MDNFSVIFLSSVVFVWAIRGMDLLAGLLFFIPKLKPVSTTRAVYPKISVIVAARNEAGKVGHALSTMLRQDYPNYEVIAVNDRSEDNTREAMESVGAKIIDIQTLPSRWLGKTHALWKGYEASSGEWLLFTDADVEMAPGTLRAAVETCLLGDLQHLTLFPELVGRYPEAVFTNFFALEFNMRYRPWRARAPRSRAYVGIGAFNFTRRDLYERAGTHERLRLEIADDMMLGKILKEAGGRSLLASGKNFVRVRWVEGFKGIWDGLHKNAFRGLEYNVFLLLAATFYLVSFYLLPVAGIFLFKGAAFYLSLASIATVFCLYAASQRLNRTSLVSFFAYPLAALFFELVLWRSAVAALARRGVVWRGTFYPLKELKRQKV